MKIALDSTLKTVINSIPNPVILTNGKELQSANSAFLDFLGNNSTEEFNNTHKCVSDLFIEHQGFFSPSKIITDENWIDYLFYRPEIKRIVSLMNQNGELRDFEITLKKLEKQSEYIVVFNDITTYVSEKNEYEYFAYHDHLTKIYNRQKFDELFIKALENKKRYKDHLSIILLDIDHFKRVNDTYGHLVGDLVLVMLSTMIAQNLRINDVFARWGGEEFIILLPRTDIQSAFIKAHELREVIETYVDNSLPKITISLGVTEVTETDTMTSCLQRVDEALFMAKEKRNDVIKLSLSSS
ncbi:MAG: hypothetical protein CJD30_09970 [Sulfuricurvum sp. PD_MW2]|uniref:sensor domain-containing diguanylate cyclase n=1 Tax=Sulfuricurvum sp. PD_MW2 TaxID=2027917 RepID=UPI000C0666C5|nr:sensor domain-containing diguanylate cyclase [Sulfuricurvum sp. PD_MW2]PHM16774.1 MAG: hypothetical protein CJD30_09970 [Sulfuricurvum sp. PD_MW2]